MYGEDIWIFEYMLIVSLCSYIIALVAWAVISLIPNRYVQSILKIPIAVLIWPVFELREFPTYTPCWYWLSSII